MEVWRKDRMASTSEIGEVGRRARRRGVQQKKKNEGINKKAGLGSG